MRLIADFFNFSKFVNICFLRTIKRAVLFLQILSCLPTRKSATKLVRTIPNELDKDFREEKQFLRKHFSATGFALGIKD